MESRTYTSPGLVNPFLVPHVRLAFPAYECRISNVCVHCVYSNILLVNELKYTNNKNYRYYIKSYLGFMGCSISQSCAIESCSMSSFRSGDESEKAHSYMSNIYSKFKISTVYK